MSVTLTGGGSGGGGVTPADLAAHAADTTAVHGFTDTTTVITNSDSRLVDQRTPLPASVDASKVAAALKPSGTAATTDEALRALGTSSATAAAGDHTHAGLTADQAAGTASIRTLGTAGTQAAAGDHTHAGLTADQAAGTASIRTLGTGATQAAAGTHTHTMSAITNVPALEVASTNAQAAINEVAAKVLPDIVNVTASTSTTTLDLASKRRRVFRVTLNANTTFAFTNLVASVYSEWSVEVVQDATGGRTVAWPTGGVRWDGGTVPAPGLGANSFNQFDFWSVGGTPYRGALTIKDGAAV
jgi:hypothetical protein